MGSEIEKSSWAPIILRDQRVQLAQAENSQMSMSYAHEAGTTGLRQFGGYVLEEWLLQLQGRRAAWAYREMMDNDPVVGSILFAIEMLARGVNYRVEGGDAERAEFIEQCMHDMSHTWLDFISEALSMLPYGWAYHEIVYKTRRGPRDIQVMPSTAMAQWGGLLANPGPPDSEIGERDDDPAGSEFKDGKIGWRKLPIRAQETLLRWDFEGYSGLRGMIQIDWHGGNNYIPIEKALLFRTKTTRKNPEGRSILRNAWTSFYRMTNIQQIEAIGIERDLAGIPVAQAPENVNIYSDAEAKTLAKVEELIQSIKKDEDQGVILPSGWDLSLLTTGGSRQIETDPIIRRYEMRIASSCLADFALLGQDQMGSYAMVDIKSELFGIAVDTVLESILSVMNQHAIPRLLKLNGMKTEDPPRIKASSAGRIDLEKVGRFLQSVALAGGPIPWSRELIEELFKEAGLPAIFDSKDGGLATEGHPGGGLNEASGPALEQKNGIRATGEGGNNARERTISATPLTKSEVQKGAMIALHPHPTVQAALAVPDGVPADQIHITLAYLGDADDIPNPQLLHETVQAFASTQAPLDGQVSGHGYFQLPEQVTYASPDVPGISRARDRLCEYLRSNGFEPSEQHGFTPHITLAHEKVDPGTVINPLHFGTVSVVMRGDRQDYPLKAIRKAEEGTQQGPAAVLADRASLLSNQLEAEVQGALGDLGEEAATAYMHELYKRSKPTARQINQAARKVLDRLDVKGWVETRLGPIMVNHAGRVALDAQRVLNRELGIEMRLAESDMQQVVKEAGQGLQVKDIEPQVRAAIVAAIHAGVESGENPTVTARRIRDSVPQGRFTRAGTPYRSELISRDQTANIQRQAALSLYKSNPRVTDLIVRDGIYGPPRSDAACMERDGEVVPIEDADNIGSNHPLCTLGFDPVLQ